MIVYEVTATVDEGLHEEFESYMRGHASEVVATGAFKSATFESAGAGRYRMRYFAETRETLDNYFAEHAPRLRRSFAQRFPQGVELSREEWNVLETFA